jgi:hypothetical protein
LKDLRAQSARKSFNFAFLRHPPDGGTLLGDAGRAVKILAKMGDILGDFSLNYLILERLFCIMSL